MELTYYKYRFPFAAPLQTAKQTFEYREGIFLEYSNNDFVCYGEVAPLPGYSPENLEEVTQKAEQLKSRIIKILGSDEPIDSLQEFYNAEELPPSLQFGLDSLAYQIKAERKGQNLQQFLFTDTDPMNQIPVNALGSLQSDQYLQETGRQISAGFETIKYKIGMDFDTELECLQAIRSKFPDLTIRLDVNQGWSTETALRRFQKLEPLNIEYCEEPLQNASPENFELLYNHTKIPLALDESVSHLSYWPNLLPFTSYLILKPMILGSFTKILETKRLADTHNNEAVFTTSLESNVGRNITAVLASGLGSHQTAHGLSTGNLLAKDVDSDINFISEGRYRIKKFQPAKIDFKKSDVSSIS